MASNGINTTIKIAKWALDNMTVEDDEGQYLAWIEKANVHVSGDTEDEAVMVAIEVTFNLYRNFTDKPKSKFTGPAKKIRKMFIELFGDGDE